MSKFKVGDKVFRNTLSDNIRDGNKIETYTEGVIESVWDAKSLYTYRVTFKQKNYPIDWNISEAFISSMSEFPKNYKEQKVIDKIKYLNKRYADSRTVSA